MLNLRRLLHRRAPPRLAPVHPVDVGLPLGAFKLCDRQSHVMESWSLRCAACVEEDEGPYDSSLGALAEPEPPAVPAAPIVPVAPPGGGPKHTSIQRPPSVVDDPPEMALAFPMSPALQQPGGARETVQLPAEPRGASPGPVKGHTEVLRPVGGPSGGRTQTWGRLVLEIDLQAPECRLGSAPGLEASLKVDLSPHHATLALVNGKARLRLSGAPGAPVLVNGLSARDDQVIHHGDKLLLGATHLRFERVDSEF